MNGPDIGEIRALEGEHDPERRRALVARLLAELSEEELLEHAVRHTQFGDFQHAWNKHRAHVDRARIIWREGVPSCKNCYEHACNEEPDASEDERELFLADVELAVGGVMGYVPLGYRVKGNVFRIVSDDAYVDHAFMTCPNCGTEYMVNLAEMWWNNEQT